MEMIRSDGFFSLMFASTARRPVASKRVQRAQSCGLKSAPFLCRNDVCNGCGYCVVSCPFGVIDRRPEPLPNAGGAFKCTFCYDRQKSGLVPACAKVCPTESIVFGRLDDLRARASQRVQQLKQTGHDDAQLYDPQETSVRGIHAFFLILGEPEAYGLPPKPQVPTIYLKSAWTSAFATAIASIIAALVAFAFFS
jgi:formate dehydrogenase iron-sulfur subunit